MGEGGLVMVEAGVVFVAAAIVGAVSVGLAFYARHHSVDEFRTFMTLYAIAMLVFAIGFTVHASAGYFEDVYESEEVEHIIQTVAHLILLGSAVEFIRSCRKTMEKTKRYQFA